MNEKQQQLTFDKGITNVPSDALCSDNALEESIGLFYDDGEHKVIQMQPIADATNIAGTLVYIHSSSQTERYIVTENNKVYWYDDNETLDENERLHELCSYTGELSISAIGNTLSMSHGGGMVYAKWNGSSYNVLYDLPDFKFVPYACRCDPSTVPVVHQPLNRQSNDYGVGGEVILVNDGRYQPWDESDTDVDYYNAVLYAQTNDVAKRQAFQSLLIGLMTEHIENCHKAGTFVFPFWVRMAIELYDGSITKHTAPILIFPSVRYSCSFKQCSKNGNAAAMPYPNSNYQYYNDWFAPQMNAKFLHFLISCRNFAGYEDIVKGVKIYVSREVQTQYVNEENWEFHNVTHPARRCWDGVSAFGDNSSLYKYVYEYESMDKYIKGDDTTERSFYCSYLYPKQKTDKEIMNDLISSSVFYNICDISYEELQRYVDSEHENVLPATVFKAEELMPHNTLVYLETLPQMEHDDYFSHTKLINGKLFSYNSRLNIYNFQRKAFEGFEYFVSESTNSERFRVFVHISTDSGVLTVKHEFDSSFIQGYYFYYPDPRAEKAEIYMRRTVDGNTVWLLLTTLALEEHPALHGAYALARLPYDTGSVWNPIFGPHEQTFFPDNFYDPGSTIIHEDSMPSVNDTEDLPNTIVTTEVNNPFVAYAEGSNRVGDGEIIGLATQTVALSSGTEFGAQPLIVFTDKGLWSMAVNSSGLYQSVHPLSREVCNRAKTITETDGAVFFSSEKGLMVIVGSEVKCVSSQLYDFPIFLKTAIIAYDYRDSLLWIFDEIGLNGTGSNYCYVYSIKSGTISRYYNSNLSITNVVNDYPDYRLQSSNKVLSLLDRVNPKLDNQKYAATIVTRPMKLENGLALKSIMQIRHICQFSPYTVTETHEDPETHEEVETETTQRGSMTLRIFASNNLDSSPDSWVELHSLRGTPWKYYKFQYDFENLLATDRFAGTILVTQERRTNKLR